jgi:pyruvate, water dikinase
MGNENSKALINRAKELNCLYNIDAILSSKELKFYDKLQRIVEVLPTGFHYSEDCCAKIVLEHEMYQNENYMETLWILASDI